MLIILGQAKPLYDNNNDDDESTMIIGVVVAEGKELITSSS